MSLDPKYLEHVADEIADKWEEFETEILEDIAKRIKVANYKATSTAQWKYWKLRELGLQSDYLSGELSRMLGVTKKDIHSIMSQAIDLSVQNDLNLMRDLKVLPNSYQITPYTSIVSRAAFNTFHEVKNWTGSMYSNTTKTFEHALDRAYLNVSSGLMTEKQAIEQAVDQLAREGILKSHTVNGRAERADVIVRRAVRTGTNITNGKVMDSILDDLDCDLVETSSHMGARPSHAEWQGKVFSRSGNNKKYPKFSTTGFGQIEGLMGINCRHSYYPFFEGLSTMSARQYSIHENNIAYELEQKQRRAENGKKHWERRKRIKDAAGVDTAKEHKKVIEWNQKISDSKRIFAVDEVNLIKSPGVGNITMDEGIKMKSHTHEVEIAQALVKEFGGDIHIYGEDNSQKGVFTPDYLWDSRLFELKGASSFNSFARGIRKALKQIKNNPGGIIIDIVSDKYSFGEKEFNEVLKRTNDKNMDIWLIVREKGVFSTFKIK